MSAVAVIVVAIAIVSVTTIAMLIVSIIAVVSVSIVTVIVVTMVAASVVSVTTIVSMSVVLGFGGTVIVLDYSISIAALVVGMRTVCSADGFHRIYVFATLDKLNLYFLVVAANRQRPAKRRHAGTLEDNPYGYCFATDIFSLYIGCSGSVLLYVV